MQKTIGTKFTHPAEELNSEDFLRLVKNILYLYYIQIIWGIHNFRLQVNGNFLPSVVCYFLLLL